MSLSKPKYKPSYDFPEEILSEIFKRLPVKYVLRCRAVQKSWYNLIKSPMFVTLHLEHQKLTAHDNPRYLLFHNVDTHMLTICCDDKQCQEYCSLEYPFDIATHEWFASANGLVCFSSMSYRRLDYDPYIYVCNPLVQICREIPRVSPLSEFTSEDIEWKALAFGYLPEVDDYVVVYVVKRELELPDSHIPELLPHELNSPPVLIGVYSLNNSSWKIVSQSQDDLYIAGLGTDRSVFVNGIAFWVGVDYGGDQLVFYFDTKTEILREISVPDVFEIQQRQLENPVIHQFGQSIAYFVENDESHQLGIWVLKQDVMDKFSWEKIMSISLSENVWADVLGIRNNGEPILAKLNNLIAYDLDTFEPYDLVNSYDHLIPNSYYEEGSKPPFVITPFYAETLLWLDKRSY